MTDHNLVQKRNLEVAKGLIRDIHDIPLNDLKFLFKCVTCGETIKNLWNIPDANYKVENVECNKCNK